MNELKIFEKAEFGAVRVVEVDGIQYETTDFAITGQGQLGLLAFFMDKYGISRQLPLLEGGRRNAAIFTPHGRKRLQ